MVLSINLRARPMPSKVVSFTYDMSARYGNAGRMAKIFMQVQRFASKSPEMDRKLSFTIRVRSGLFTLAGYYYGPAQSFMRNIEPEMAKAVGVDPKVQLLTFEEALQKIGGGVPLRQPKRTYDRHSHFIAKSLLVPENDPLTQSAIERYFEYAIKKGGEFKNRWITTFRLMGGRDSQVPKRGVSELDDCAVSQRDSLWIIQNDGQTDSRTGKMMEFIDGLTNSIPSAQAHTVFQAFAPFSDPELSREQAQAMYFSKLKLLKLQILKRRYDRKSVFWNPHSISPSTN